MKALLFLLALAAPMTHTCVERESGALSNNLHRPDHITDTPALAILCIHGGVWQNASRQPMRLIHAPPSLILKFLTTLRS